MRVAIIGGRLQGLEATYLAKKAGWQVLLIDKRSDVPAAGLCDRFFCLDALDQHKLLAALGTGIELIIPALENLPVLQAVGDAAKISGIPFAFDPAAYNLSLSKARSDRYFAELGIPVPLPWPGGSFPYLAKPSESSGSEGVVTLGSEAELQDFLTRNASSSEQWVIQEYLEGPSYSIEVCGTGAAYLPLQVTDLHMDEIYDCKRVTAPSVLSRQQQKIFADMAVKLAAGINLKGIMDVEVILNKGELKVLEIDARLPSQTPTAVYHSCGVNLLELLAAVFTAGKLPAQLPDKPEQAAIFEHLVVEPNRLKIAGEHVVATAGPLQQITNFFGADEALTNYRPGRKSWMATLIVTGADMDEALARRNDTLARISSEMKIKRSLED